MDTDNQRHQPEPQTGKRGVFRAYALVISVGVAFLALLWAVHLPLGVSNALVILASVVSH
jgi:aminopeptidase-like protein